MAKNETAADQVVYELLNDLTVDERAEWFKRQIKANAYDALGHCDQANRLRAAGETQSDEYTARVDALKALAKVNASYREGLAVLYVQGDE